MKRHTYPKSKFFRRLMPQLIKEKANTVHPEGKCAGYPLVSDLGSYEVD